MKNTKISKLVKIGFTTVIGLFMAGAGTLTLIMGIYKALTYSLKS